MKVGIIGATGYGGAELIRLLQQHPNVTIAACYSSSQYGSETADSFPHLQSVGVMELRQIDIEEISQNIDLVFLSTPSGISSKLVPRLINAGTRVIDLSGDFRLKNPNQYEAWYNKESADTELLKNAVYGLTEWVNTDMSRAQLLANPGCYPTAALLGLAPLMNDKIIDPSSIIIDAKTGVSGAGRTTGEIAHFPEMNDNLKIYSVHEHKHIPEIEQELINWNFKTGPITMSTHLIPMTRGIMTTIYADAPKGMTEAKLTSLYKDSYKDSYFVRVKEQDSYPSTKDVYGSNFCDVSLTIDKRTNRIMIISVIDNLVKGAAGQAVQNMNRMFNFDEKTGLAFAPIYP